MKNFVLLTVLALPFAASANTLLECFARDGKFATQEVSMGSIALSEQEVTLFQRSPVSESVSFDVAGAVTESSRTGSWTTYTSSEMSGELVTLQLENSGKVRRGYVTRDNSVLAVKCTEN